MIDIGAELQKAYDEGYADGKRDAAPRWHRVEEPPDMDEYVLAFDGDIVGYGIV